MVAEAFAAGGGRGDDDVVPTAQAVYGFGLMGVKAVYAYGFQGALQSGVQGFIQSSCPGNSGMNVFGMDYLPFVPGHTLKVF